MDAERVLDEQVWKILLKIKEQEQLGHWSEFGVLQFGHPSENEKKILLLLQDEKVIELLNLSRNHKIINVPGDIAQLEGIKLKVIQPAFDKKYQEYEVLVNKSEVNQNLSSKSAKSSINDIIATRNIRGMEKKLLQALSGLKPVSFTDLKRETGTKSLKALKFSTQEKLNGTGWSIESPKRAGWGNDSFYQLEKLTS